MKYAQVVDGAVHDIAHADPATIYHADVAALYSVQVPDSTQIGATLVGGVWTNPPAPTAPPVRLPVLTPEDFYLAFTSAERRAIKGSSDGDVQEFWATFEMMRQARKPIDPNLASVTNALRAFSLMSPPLILPARIPAILAGTPQ